MQTSAENSQHALVSHITMTQSQSAQKSIGGGRRGRQAALIRPLDHAELSTNQFIQNMIWTVVVMWWSLKLAVTLGSKVTANWTEDTQPLDYFREIKLKFLQLFSGQTLLIIITYYQHNRSSWMFCCVPVSIHGHWVVYFCSLSFFFCPVLTLRLQPSSRNLLKKKKKAKLKKYKNMRTCLCGDLFADVKEWQELCAAS